MTKTPERTRRVRRAALAAALVLPLMALFSPPSIAHPTKADVASAKSKIAAINHELEIVVEQYDGARVQLQRAQQQLASAKAQMDHDRGIADRAKAQLDQRAAAAYTQMGTQATTLLGASSFTEFSDRLEFMSVLAQNDADLATTAGAAQQRATWATQRYGAAVKSAKAQLAAVNASRDRINGLLDQAQAYYRHTVAHYHAYLAEQRRLLARQRAQDAAAAVATTTGTPAPTPTPPPVPPNLQGAAAAIAAARSVLGVQYVFAAADPSVGFDCSGLTMWSWAHAGVYLPHNALMQYDALPHIALSQLEPGDLIFFYSPISHVAMYLGGGLIIHATHPGPGGQVHIESLDPIWRPLITAAARP